ncbi:sphingosine-1-phosphate phosphatase 2-like isoform X2 [Prorops nasuta]|uniref:sphingosine-1-phosphate phosphatase 2-like isoform X2 n=1 Tax=Prorops nasuta TaxID=863751 RepID=UPI0034CEA002
MWKAIDYLKSSDLVADIQEFFGIKIHYDSKENNEKVKYYKNEKENKIYSHYGSFNDIDVNHSLTENINGCSTLQTNYNGYAKSDVSTKEEQVYSKEKYFRSSMSQSYTITNYYWYYLFLFGTELGDEIFYSTFIPFWFWNIDGAVGRRIILVWAVVMTTGQVLKDIICWPRPSCPPAVRLQSKWSQEYGMPSTHAMIGVSIPFSVVLFTMNRYTYQFPIGCLIAFLWCTLVSTSRIYLGMHTILDIVAGLLLAIILMIPLVPLMEITDYYLVTNIWFLLILAAISICVIIYHPLSEKWTPTRGDTTMVVSVTVGVHIGTWLNYISGLYTTLTLSPPFQITWPSFIMLSQLILRTVIGFSLVIGTKVTCKYLVYSIFCAIYKLNYKELLQSQNFSGNPKKIFIDLVSKYVICFMIGVNAVYLIPNIFTIIGIGRSTFYTEL